MQSIAAYRFPLGTFGRVIAHKMQLCPNDSIVLTPSANPQFPLNVITTLIHPTLMYNTCLDYPVPFRCTGKLNTVLFPAVTSFSFSG